VFANKTLKVIYILGRTYTWNKNLFEDYLSTRFINPFGVETQKAHNFLDVYTVKRLISQMWIEVQLQFVKFAHVCKILRLNLTKWVSMFHSTYLPSSEDEIT